MMFLRVWQAMFFFLININFFNKSAYLTSQQNSTSSVYFCQISNTIVFSEREQKSHHLLFPWNFSRVVLAAV